LPSVKTAGALPPSHKHTYGVKSLVLGKEKGGGGWEWDGGRKK
jgi:hypothetical protein